MRPTGLVASRAVTFFCIRLEIENFKQRIYRGRKRVYEGDPGINGSIYVYDFWTIQVKFS